MNTAYHGEGPSRRGSPVKFLLAAMAMAFIAAPAAMAQQPATPPATPEASAPATPETAPAPTDAAPAAPTDAAPAAAEAPKNSMEEQFGIVQVWNSSIVAKGTLIIMVLMFAGTIYIAATKAVDQTFLLG